MVKGVFTYTEHSFQVDLTRQGPKRGGHRVGSGSKAATGTVAIRTYLGDVSWSGRTFARRGSSSRRQYCGETNP